MAGHLAAPTCQCLSHEYSDAAADQVPRWRIAEAASSGPAAPGLRSPPRSDVLLGTDLPAITHYVFLAVCLYLSFEISDPMERNNKCKEKREAAKRREDIHFG